MQSLSLDEIQLSVGPENDASVFKQAASSAIGTYGFDFDHDFQAVIPTSDFTNVLLRHRIMDTWNFGTAIVADGSTISSLKQALTAALKHSPL